MENNMDGSGLNSERKATKGCRIGCLSMIVFFTALIFWISVGQSPSNYLTFRIYRPDRKRNNIEEVTGIGFPSFKVVKRNLYDHSILGGLCYDVELEFDDVPDDEFYLKLDSLCDLGIITGPARHENRKLWKHYDVSYNPELADDYFFKHILRDRRNIHRIIVYTVELAKGQKTWRIRISDRYEGDYSETEIRIE